jgi:hypothetical protein
LKLRQSTRTCEPKWYVYACGCSKKLVKSGCMHRDCLTCEDQVGARRASRCRWRLDAGREGRPVLYTVLTVPPELRARYADPAVWRSACRRAWKVLRKQFGAEYGLEASHPAGEDLEVFHPHANFLWVQRPGFRPFLDVAALRRAWARILGYDGEVVVYHRYADAPGKIAHWARYVTRTFPGWSWWTPSVRWYGAFPRELPDREVVCPGCGQPFRFVGEASPEEVQAFEGSWKAGGVFREAG